MKEFFRNQWSEIKGNAKWDMIKWIISVGCALVGGSGAFVVMLQRFPVVLSLAGALFGVAIGMLLGLFLTSERLQSEPVENIPSLAPGAAFDKYEQQHLAEEPSQIEECLKQIMLIV